MIARAPVSKFPTEPSAFTIFVDSCDVSTMVRFRDAHATVKIRLVYSNNPLRHEVPFTVAGGSWKKKENEGITSRETYRSNVSSSEQNPGECN